MEKIKIAIADDQTLFRQTLGTLIKGVDQFELVAEAESGDDLLRQLRQYNIAPIVALIDMKMPGMNGLELHKILQQDHPQVKVIVLSIYNEKRLVSTMIDAGACSYLEKNCDKDELIGAITSVYKNGFYMNNQIMEALRSPVSSRNRPVKSFTEIPFDITRREQEILKLICLELSNAEIADQLFLSTRTVEGHRNNLIIKTGCKNTAGLVLFAVKNNIYNLALH